MHNVDNVHEITCVARENVARATVEMVEGANFEKFTSDIKTEVEAIDDFPDLVEKPVIRQLGTRDFVTSVALSAPVGSPLELTECTVERTIAALRAINREEKPRQPGARDLVRNITVEYNRNDTAGETGTHVATITADLLDAEIRTIRIEEVLAKWREKTKDLPDVVWIRFSETKIGPAGLDIEIRLQGDDLKKMKAVMAWLKGYVGAVDISDDLRPGKPEFCIRLKPGARMLGLNGRLVADQLRAIAPCGIALELDGECVSRQPARLRARAHATFPARGPACACG